MKEEHVIGRVTSLEAHCGVLSLSSDRCTVPTMTDIKLLAAKIAATPLKYLFKGRYRKSAFSTLNSHNLYLLKKLLIFLRDRTQIT